LHVSYQVVVLPVLLFVHVNLVLGEVLLYY
jgi:hypothetical protein